MSEDLSHDAHLRAALRHAPDHALAPPAGVNQAILAAARQAHRPVRATPAAPPVQMVPAHLPAWLHWWHRLATPRWAGALATGLVAALGLGLWLDIGQSPVVERPATPGLPSADIATTAPQATPPAAQRDAATTAARDASANAESRAAAPAPTDRPAAKMRADAATRAARRSTPGAEAPAAASLKREEDPSSRNAGSIAPEPSPDRDRVMAPPAMPPQTAAPPIAKAAPPTAAAPTAAQSPIESSEPEAQSPDARLALAQRGAGTANVAASPALALLRRVRTDHAARATRWTWQAPQASTITAFDDMGEAWLSRVVQAAGNRWTDAADHGPPHDAIEVRWWRDGWPHATLRIEADGLRWVEANGRIQYAPMEHAALQRLRSM